MTTFTEFETSHRDLVTVTKFNFYGNRILTASADHRIKVWDQKDGNWDLIDTWRAHDAEVRDAAWNGPFTGQHIGTVGEDMKFKLWQEDVTQPTNSGRRFRNIFRLTSPIRTPYVSLDFRNLDLESWLALVTRDGLLTVLEPVGPDSLAEWQPLDQFRVCAEPSRGEETSFKVQFHHDPVDITRIAMPSWESKSLSLVVAAMATVKIYRMNEYKKFYHAIELTGHTSLVRDISWANGSVRGFDIIGSGSKDGTIKIFEVYTSVTNVGNNSTNGATKPALPPASRGASARTPTQSGIGTALASQSPETPADAGRGPKPPFKHTFKEVASIESKHLDAWQVQFSPAGTVLPHPTYRGYHFFTLSLLTSRLGDCLLSSGDDGSVRLWKRAISGEWLEFAETTVNNN
ncbi:epoxide hydrolase, soluble (sEH) [Myotisia sp. PD_48]|nr:epoxide hydrolase, soluble (sEH) [Myotisia sp. PD_48]